MAKAPERQCFTPIVKNNGAKECRVSGNKAYRNVALKGCSDAMRLICAQRESEESLGRIGKGTSPSEGDPNHTALDIIDDNPRPE